MAINELPLFISMLIYRCESRRDFGVYPEVILLEAREKAFEARRQLRDGKDLAQLRREQKSMP